MFYAKKIHTQGCSGLFTVI